MILYAESSAVGAWLAGESQSPRMKALLKASEFVVASDLTLIECDRMLVRAVTLGRIAETEAIDRGRELSATANGWNVLPIGDEIVARARRPFPSDPIRTLDAIHLASILAARVALPGLEVLSLDDRVRNAARDLGFKLQPR